MTTATNTVPAKAGDIQLAPQTYQQSMNGLNAMVDSNASASGVVSIQPGQLSVVQVQAGKQYKLRKTGNPNQTPDDLIAVRHGDALHVRYADGSVVHFEGFFSTFTDSSVCSVNLASDSAAGSTLGADALSSGPVADDGMLVYAHGNPNVLMSMAQDQSGLSSAIQSAGLAGNVTYLAASPILGSSLFALLAAGGLAVVAGATTAQTLIGVPAIAEQDLALTRIGTFVIGASTATALQSLMGAGGNTTQLATINGGTGLDTLQFSGGASLDLTKVSNAAMNEIGINSRIESIERIDMRTDTGANTLTLAVKDVLDITGMNLINAITKASTDWNWTGGTYNFATTEMNHQLVIDGTSVDKVITSGGFVDMGTAFMNGHTYEVYNQAASHVQLLIDQSINRTQVI
jgi:hypothetical protein